MVRSLISRSAVFAGHNHEVFNGEKTMKRLAIACVAVLGMMVVGSTAAEAGGISIRFGSNAGYGYNNGYGYNRGYSQNYYGGYGGYGYNRSPRVYHDTSHYDYHPGQVVRHRNHLHSQPGHYDFHRSGHVDTLYNRNVHHGGH